MATSEFWRELADKLSAIADPQGLLRADWSIRFIKGSECPSRTDWRLVGPKLLQASFEALVRRGGIAIDPTSDSLEVWLGTLKTEGLNEGSQVHGLESDASGETVAHHLCGTIERVYEASIMLCRFLESRALEAARIAQQPIPEPPGTAAPNSLKIHQSEDPAARERTELLLAFKSKGKNLGIKITDEMIAKAAKPGRWNDRTMVTWWKRNDPRCKPPHDKLVRAVLAREPASVWPPT